MRDDRGALAGVERPLDLRSVFVHRFQIDRARCVGRIRKPPLCSLDHRLRAAQVAALDVVEGDRKLDQPLQSVVTPAHPQPFEHLVRPEKIPFVPPLRERDDFRFRRHPIHLRTREVAPSAARNALKPFMDQHFRALFNEAFNQDLYERYSADLRARVGAPTLFRLAETPVFLTREFSERCERAALEIVAQLCEPDRQSKLERAIPDRYRSPNRDALPNFAMFDFAAVKSADGSYAPQLIELQGFPSLMAFTLLQRDAWATALAGIVGLDLDWSCWYGDLDRDTFSALASRCVLGSHDPQRVILMDLQPEKQKTNADFAATKQLWGVDAISPTDLVKRGKRLYRRDAPGNELPVERIYNRTIFEELDSQHVLLPFDFRDELDVEWAPHPDWFWMWSKFAIPFLDHPCVPKARFVSELDGASTLGRVLKPAFSFSGGGVNLAPTLQDLERIPAGERGDWLLQERVTYAPAIRAADGGGVKFELRVMLLRPDDAPSMIPAENLCRLSRGDMVGVNFNENDTWVGSSVGILPAWRPHAHR